MQRYRHRTRPGLLDRLLVLVGAGVLTVLFFLVLPLIQAISETGKDHVVLQSVDVANLPPPPPPPPPEPEQEEKPEEKPPELVENPQPLDLSQLELALSTSMSGSWTTGDFSVRLHAGGSSEETDGLFSLADLDQKPRAIYQPSPVLTPQARKRAPGTVHVLFVVDASGKVENPVVQSSSDPVFDRPALDAIRKWKFEPGKRNGQPVRFRMRQQFTFPQS